jgi:tRNA (guanine37-N1)-methyltransferase
VSLSVRVLTVCPGLVESALAEGMVRIARESGELDLRTIDIREFTRDLHRTTDDTPYGGGSGMVMKVEPVVRAWRSLAPGERGKAYIMSARGRSFDQETARRMSGAGAITLVCGRYKGVDQRVVDILEAEEVSLGDFVLAGGELAAAVMVEAVARLLPGVLGDVRSGAEDSHEEGLLGYPDFTRPEDFEGHRVPEVLLSGHHARIAAWRRERRLETTWRRRPDLLDKAVLSDQDGAFLRSLERGPRDTRGAAPAGPEDKGKGHESSDASRTRSLEEEGP